MPWVRKSCTIWGSPVYDIEIFVTWHFSEIFVLIRQLQNLFDPIVQLRVHEVVVRSFNLLGHLSMNTNDTSRNTSFTCIEIFPQNCEEIIVFLLVIIPSKFQLEVFVNSALLFKFGALFNYYIHISKVRANTNARESYYHFFTVKKKWSKQNHVLICILETFPRSIRL